MPSRSSMDGSSGSLTGGGEGGVGAFGTVERWNAGAPEIVAAAEVVARHEMATKRGTHMKRLISVRVNWL